jgi:tetratricopeptide (TPR) repeat protein
VNDQLQLALRSSKRFRHLGQYAEALTAFEPLPDPGPSLAVVEMAWVCAVQGYWKVARDIVQSAVTVPGDEIILIHAALYELVTLGKVRHAVEVANQIFDKTVGNSTWQECEPGLAFSIELCFHRIQLFAAGLREIDGSKPRRLAEQRLSVMIESLIQANRMDDAFDALILLIHVLSAQDAFDLLQNFYGRCIEQSLRGTLKLEIVKAMRKLGSPLDDIENEINSAAEMYAACGNETGLLDVTLFRLSQSEPSDIDQTVQALLELWRKYDTLKHLRGALETYMKIVEVLPPKGDLSRVTLALEGCHQLAETGGSTILMLQFYFRAILSHLIQSGHSGAVLQGCQGLLQLLEESELRFLKAMAFRTLSSAYMELRMGPEAVKYGELAQEQFTQLGMMEDASDQVDLTSRAMLILDHLPVSERPTVFKEVRHRLCEWIQLDAHAGRVRSQVEKYFTLISFEYERRHVIGNDSVVENGSHWHSKASALMPLLSTASLSQCLPLALQWQGALRFMSGDLQAARADLKSAADMYKLPGFEYEAASSQQMIAMSILANYQHTHDASLLDDALKYLEEAKEKWLAFGLTEQAITCFYFIAIVQEARCFDSPMRSREGQTHAFGEAIQSLYRARHLYEGVRREMSVLPPLLALQLKARLAAQDKASNIRSFGLELGLRNHDIAGAWGWLQAAKASSLSDLIGLNIVVPPRLLSGLDDECLGLLDSERKLLQNIQQATGMQRATLLREYEDVRARMLKQHSLGDIIRLQDGREVTLDELHAMLNHDRKIVCIDYALLRDQKITLFAIRPGEQVQMFPVTMTNDDVIRWKSMYLNVDDLQYMPKVLAKLAPLIEPIFKVSSEEDLLIISPTGALHGIPLHAVPVQGTVLLERNPVAYNSSLSVLKLCLTREESPCHKAASVFGVPKDRPGALSSATSLAQRLGTQPILGDDASVAAFCQHAQQSDLVYFHGHADFHRVDPLASYLRFSDGILTAANVCNRMCVWRGADHERR